MTGASWADFPFYVRLGLRLILPLAAAVIRLNILAPFSGHNAAPSSSSYPPTLKKMRTFGFVLRIIHASVASIMAYWIASISSLDRKDNRTLLIIREKHPWGVKSRFWKILVAIIISFTSFQLIINHLCQRWQIELFGSCLGARDFSALKDYTVQKQPVQSVPEAYPIPLH